jgi:hypothetical protein
MINDTKFAYGSSRSSFIPMMEAPDLRQINDSAKFEWMSSTWDWGILFRGQMCPTPLLVFKVLLQDIPQTSFIEFDHMNQTLSSN